ncbi:MAG: helix-turn-helix domain-containing protein [Candidatus Aenigmarchaeota archaeon]|nr:helix-turn-helix domain-containing protein [Candidatus Aenigmarchaeota archaeon]
MNKTELKDDSEFLAKLAKECKNANERERLRALYVISIGHSIPKVSKMFCVDEATIYRWVKQWKQEKNISNKSKTGRPHSLDENKKKSCKFKNKQDF